MTNEDELSSVLEAVKNGDAEAFHRLYIQFASPLYKFLALISRSTTVAEELTQHIFAQIWIERNRIDPQKHFERYLFTRAKHALSNYYRSKKVRDMHASNLTQGEENAADANMIVKETEKYISMAIKSMPRQRQRIFEYSYEDGLSTEEIAQRLQISKQAVEKQISYARRHIRILIAQLSGENR
jgi:RNA polymerase sigma-70 factor (ECF subfamily)